jgi:N-acetylmuramoyl-L-alanine amidase
MRINDQHRLEAEEGDLLEFPELGGGIPNDSPKPQEDKRAIVIHATASASLSGAVSDYRVKPNKDGSPRRSMHLFIGRDGTSVFQAIPFNTSANHTRGYNGKSIGIQLEYPGQLTDKLTLPFDKTTVFTSKQYLLASSINSSTYISWALFPEAQLNTLLNVCRALRRKYPGVFTDVAAADELSSASHPGPAFPIAQFREKLLGVTDKSFILQEMKQTVHLLGQPANPASALYPTPLSQGAHVTIVNEKDEWYLVSETDAQATSWRIGWVKKEAVQVITDFTPMVRPNEHVLRTSEGRRIQYIQAHTNGYNQGKSNPNPEYIVMHFTTGMKMESTISTFKNPSSRVATHLLIGRDGRVVQFLPFDAIAHHSGYSWWEGKSNMNRMSIGIELDNAGLLIRDRKTGAWVRRGQTFKPERVGRGYHEKQYRPLKRHNESELEFKKRFAEFEPGWEKFTDVQIEVALKVVKALRERYKHSMIEILGHDAVNLRNRYDPGPLFDMERFRFELFQRREATVKEYTITHPTEELYANYRGRRPNPKQSAFDASLPANSTVIVRKQEEDHDYVLVDVIASKNPQAKVRGWIQRASLSDPDPKFVRALKRLMQQALRKGKKGAKPELPKIPDRRKTTIDQKIFRPGEGSPTPPMDEGNLFGKKVRIQMVRGEWTLVVFLGQLNGRGGVEGWIRTEYLSPDPIQ